MSIGEQRPLRRRFETRRRLLAAAATLFDERGTTRQSVEAICAHAGYTRGAFYSNFSGVDELYLALHQQQAAAVWERLQTALERQLDGSARAESLERGVERLLESVPPEREWYALRAVLLARASADPEFAQGIRLDHNPFVEELGLRFQAFAAIYGRLPTVEPSLFASAIVAAHTGAVSQAAITDDAARVTQVVVVGIIRGLTEELSPPTA